MVGSLAFENLIGHIGAIYNELKSQLQQAHDFYNKYVGYKLQPILKVGQ